MRMDPDGRTAATSDNKHAHCRGAPLARCVNGCAAMHRLIMSLHSLALKLITGFQERDAPPVSSQAQALTLMYPRRRQLKSLRLLELLRPCPPAPAGSSPGTALDNRNESLVPYVLHCARGDLAVRCYTGHVSQPKRAIGSKIAIRTQRGAGTWGSVDHSSSTHIPCSLLGRALDVPTTAAHTAANLTSIGVSPKTLQRTRST